MKIAIVILTYKRHKLLKRCIESILRADNANFEINFYIGINGADEETYNYLKSFSSMSHFKFISFTHPLSVGEARNRLIGLCSEQWICFLDDDIEVNRDYFVQAHKIINNDHIKIFGGPDQSKVESTDFQFLLGCIMQSFWATGPTRYRHKRVGDKLIKCSELELILCNLWAHRDCFSKYLFPKNFKRNEENYWLSKINKDGVHFYYSPNLFVYHHRKNNFYNLIKVLFLAGSYRMISNIYDPKSFKPITIIHLVLLIMLSILLVFSSKVFFVIVLMYVLVLLLSSLVYFHKTKAIKSLYLTPIFFIVFHFSYPIGQIQGGVKALVFKLRGVNFEDS